MKEELKEYIRNRESCHRKKITNHKVRQQVPDRLGKYVWM